MADTATLPLIIEPKDIVRKEVPISQLNSMQRRPYAVKVEAHKQPSHYQTEFCKKDGKPALPLRVEDHIKAGDLKLRDTTYRTEYKNSSTPRNGNRVPESLLDGKITEEARRSHLAKHGEFYPNHSKSPAINEYITKPASYVKPKPFDRRFKLEGQTEYDSRFQGPSQPIKLMKDPLNNLTTYDSLSAEKMTNYRRQHGAKSPNAAANKALFETNKDFDRNTSPYNKRPTVKGTTVYDRDFNEMVKSANGGPDRTLNKALHSYYNSYYFENK